MHPGDTCWRKHNESKATGTGAHNDKLHQTIIKVFLKGSVFITECK